ncbi:MAG: right-handed parallel beta-helix repeat-containing protein [Thiotrichaceae bacterium]
MFLLIFLLLTTSPVWAVEIWVDVNHGDDTADGTVATPLRTLQHAANLATAGSIVHIQPGIYRETLKPLHSGTAENPIIYQAVQSNTVTISGAEQVTTWQPLTENRLGFPETKLKQIIWADLPNSNAVTPRFISRLDALQQVQRLNVAREPDWRVQTEWKQHEFWWTADGGSAEVACTPAADCETASRSLTQLTDIHDDTEPQDVAKGNLTTLGNLTGATLVATDNSQGYFIYRLPIVNHEVSEGRITLGDKAEYKTTDAPGLGWGSKYYVENHPALLDSEGEYWFDTVTKRLYILANDLPQLEVSQRDTCVDLSNLSYITLDGLNIELCQETAIQLWNAADQGSRQITLKNMKLNYANHGIWLEQNVATPSTNTNSINGFILENSEISNMDTDALFFDPKWNNSNSSDAPISNIIIANNEFHHLSYRAQKNRAAGLELNFADHIIFKNNKLHHTAFDGLKFNRSLIQSVDPNKSFNFSPQEIKTGTILIDSNVIEKTCQLVADCGALTFVGLPPHNHVFRDVFIINNTIRNNFGWSAVAELRGNWNGLFAFGIYATTSSGLVIYRNLLYKNSWANIFGFQSWRDGEMLIVNNVLANANYGLGLWSNKEYETHPNVNTQIINNIFVNNEEYGVHHKGTADDPQFNLNHNLYYANAWQLSSSKLGVMSNIGVVYRELEDVQQHTPWEQQGVNRDPLFLQYDYFAARNRYDTSPVNWQIRTGSAAIDQGGTILARVSELLAQFGIIDLQLHAAPDIGVFEYFNDNQGIALNLSTREHPATAAQFFGKVEVETTDNYLLNQQQLVNLTAEIIPDTRDVGQAAQIFMVGIYTTPQFQSYSFMRQADTWLRWDEKFESLVAAFNVSALPEKLPLEIYTGNFAGMPGKFTVYVGYAVNGVLAYSGQLPIQFLVQ